MLTHPSLLHRAAPGPRSGAPWIPACCRRERSFELPRIADARRCPLIMESACANISDVAPWPAVHLGIWDTIWLHTSRPAARVRAWFGSPAPYVLRGRRQWRPRHCSDADGQSNHGAHSFDWVHMDIQRVRTGYSHCTLASDSTCIAVIRRGLCLNLPPQTRVSHATSCSSMAIIATRAPTATS